MLQPCSRRVGQEQWEIADDKIITDCTIGPAGELVVLEPQARVCFPGVFWDVSRRSVSGREHRLEDMPTESLGPRWFGAMTPVLLMVAAPTAVRVVATVGCLLSVTLCMPSGVQGEPSVMVAAETPLDQGHGGPSTALQ